MCWPTMLLNCRSVKITSGRQCRWGTIFARETLMVMVLSTSFKFKTKYTILRFFDSEFNN